MELKTYKHEDEKIVRMVSEGEHEWKLYDLITDDREQLVVFHHNDIDGKLAARLVYNGLGAKHFIECNYSTELPDVSFIKDTDVVFIVDYCLPIEQLKAIVEKASLVLWMDHHETSIRTIDKNLNYFLKSVKEEKLFIDIDMTKCGARIVNDWFQKGYLGVYAWNQDVIYMVDNYDRWTKKDIRGDYINQFMFNSAQSYVESDAWKGLLYNKLYLESALTIGKDFYEFNIKKNELIYKSFSREVEFHGMKMSVIEGFGNSQLFGTHINDYDAVSVYHRTSNGKWQYSFFSVRDDINLAKLAELYGGGGHFSASGATVDKKLF